MVTAARAVGRRRRANVWAVIPRVFVEAFLVCLGVVVIYPLIWMVLSGFKSNVQIFGNPFALPIHWVWSNYVQAWNDGVQDYLVTSVLVTVASTICTVLISAWAAFGLTRTRIPGKPMVSLVVLGGMMLSPTVALIPLVKMFQSLGLYDTRWALIVLYTAFRVPFTVFLIRAYMLDLPRELDEAAVIDGASESQLFWRVTLPLCVPIIVACVILHVLFAWNEFLFAMIFTGGTKITTLAVGLTTIMAKHGTNYGEVFAAMTISALPIAIVFFAGQRYFVRGLSEGIGK